MRKRVLRASLFLVCLLPAGASPAAAGWAALPNAPQAPLIWSRHDDVFFVSPDTGWVVNGGGEVHRTNNGGNTWTLQAILPHYLRCVGFANSLNGWAGTLFVAVGQSEPQLYATNTGGAAWTPVLNIPPPLPEGICGLSVVNSSVVYGCGAYYGPPARMIKTTDGGLTWTSWDMTPYCSSLIDCYFFDENNGFAVGGLGPSLGDRQAIILATTDGGATWERRHLTDRPGGEWCWKISFPTPTVGYVSVERQDGKASSYCLKTTDGGRTWADVDFLDGFDEEGIGFVTPSLGWIGGWSGPTFQTTDGGLTWEDAGFGTFVNRFRFLSDTLGYAVGATVYKYTAHATTDVAAERPGVALLQNRPNPVHGSTRISFSLATEANVRVTVHDVQGRKIATLLEGRRPSGRQELVWDTRDAAGRPVGAGVYWYRVVTAQSTQARKLLVIR